LQRFYFFSKKKKSFIANLNLIIYLFSGFGFVNMVKYEDAQSAINSLHGAQIGPKTLQVSFKKDGK